MKKLIGFTCLTFGLITACTAGNAVVKRVPFPEAEYAALRTLGDGMISGQVYVEAKHGEKMPKAGCKVILNPVTTYSVQWYGTARLKQPLEAPDPRLLSYVREAITDAEGRFRFTNVPEGEYFVTTPLVWEGPWRVGSVGYKTAQGHFAVQKIHVREKEDVTCDLGCRLRITEENLDISRPPGDNMPVWTSTAF